MKGARRSRKPTTTFPFLVTNFAPRRGRGDDSPQTVHAAAVARFAALLCRRVPGCPATRFAGLRVWASGDICEARTHRRHRNGRSAGPRAAGRDSTPQPAPPRHVGVGAGTTEPDAFARQRTGNENSLAVADDALTRVGERGGPSRTRRSAKRLYDPLKPVFPRRAGIRRNEGSLPARSSAFTRSSSSA